MKRGPYIPLDEKASVRQLLARLRYDLKVTLGGEARILENGKIFESVQVSPMSFPEKVFVRYAKNDEAAVINTLMAAIMYYEGRDRK